MKKFKEDILNCLQKKKNKYQIVNSNLDISFNRKLVINRVKKLIR